jgi:16S rRNA (adenine1518-N6/adenine1519-N6)-dimethyltransferase
MGTSAIVRNVPPSAFRPQPRVNSCILEIKIEKNRTLASERTWRGLLQRSFTQRRKTLVNNWISGYPEISREVALEILEKYELKPSSRAEELSLDLWQRLSEEPLFYLKPKA